MIDALGTFADAKLASPDGIRTLATELGLEVAMLRDMRSFSCPEDFIVSVTFGDTTLGKKECFASLSDEPPVIGQIIPNKMPHGVVYYEIPGFQNRLSLETDSKTGEVLSAVVTVMPTEGS